MYSLSIALLLLLTLPFIHTALSPTEVAYNQATTALWFQYHDYTLAQGITTTDAVAEYEQAFKELKSLYTRTLRVCEQSRTAAEIIKCFHDGIALLPSYTDYLTLRDRKSK